MNIERVMNVSTNRLESLSFPSPANSQVVLAELFTLLEEYCPTWYTQEHHDRAITALFKRDW